MGFVDGRLSDGVASDRLLQGKFRSCLLFAIDR